MSDCDRHVLEHIAVRLAQDPTDWRGYYRPRNEAANYGRRFQVAYSAYAIFAAAQRDPGWRLRAPALLACALQRMTTWPVWGYWRAGNPLAEHNAQYAGHLLAVWSCARLLSSAPQELTLTGPQGEACYTVTAQWLAHNLVRQMRASRCGGVGCEPGFVYPTCMGAIGWGLALYRRWSGETLYEETARWRAFLEQRLVVRGRLPPGVVRCAYGARQDLAAPFTLAITDAWTLFHLAAEVPELACRLAARLRPRLRHGRLAALPGMDRLEIGGTALATAFAAALARELGWDEAGPLRDQLGRWAALPPERRPPPWPWIEALYALALTLYPGELANVFGPAL